MKCIITQRKSKRESKMEKTNEGKKATFNTPQWKINQLLKYKIELQEKEEELKKNKIKWRKLSKTVRSQSQDVYQRKETLIDMI